MAQAGPIAALSAAPGTYVLVMESTRRANITIGKLGNINFTVGFYLYVGSAFGPGGVNARVTRHLKQNKLKRWHVDYLTDKFAVVECWITYDKVHREHAWAKTLHKHAQAISGFGCTDCKCDSHLFYALAKPRFTSFAKNCASSIERQAKIHRFAAPCENYSTSNR